MRIGHPRLHARGCNVSITISPAANGWRTRPSGRSGQTPLSEFENHETRFVATERKPTPTIANQIFAFLEACVMDYEARTTGAWNKHGQRATGSILCISDRNNKCRKKGRATESLRLGCVPGNKFTGRQTCEKERERSREIAAKLDMTWGLEARSVWVRKFRGRVLLQKGRHHFRIVLKRTQTKMALLTVRYIGGREDLIIYKCTFCFGVHSAVSNHDPVVYTHWSNFRAGSLNGVSKWSCCCCHRRHYHHISPHEDYVLFSSRQDSPLISQRSIISKQALRE
jgi:hypothetical protein